MKVMLTHVVFKVSGVPAQLPAFDARLKLLFADQQIASDCDEAHAADALHYDFKVQSGIPFPPFAIASGEFPDLTVEADWVAAGSGVHGTAIIKRGELTEKLIENVAAVDADQAIAIRVNADGYLALALTAIRTGSDECCGYMLTGAEDALFRIARDAADGTVELWATQGTAEWSRAWRLSAAGTGDYEEIEPAQPIAAADYRELTQLAQEFVARWIWFGDGPREEIVIEAERYARLGYAVNDANVRSAALHRIRGGAENSGEGISYSTLAPEIAWIEDAIARCWPGQR
ncbi:MAG: hypothetical protein ABIS45_06045 [Burkholderiales bacterium]